MLDFADELEGTLLDLPGRSDAGLDRESLQDSEAGHVSEDEEHSEMDDALDGPSESSLTEDEEENDIGGEESDDSDEWAGSGADKEEETQHDQATEHTAAKDSDTRPSGTHRIVGQRNGNDTSTGRYIPPGLRKQSGTSEGEDAVKLTRQLKGLINR